MATPLGSYVFEEFVFQFRNNITHLPDRQLYFMLSKKDNHISVDKYNHQ